MCDIVWCQDDEAFEVQCFLWERGASAGADFGLFNFQDLLHAQETILHNKGKVKDNARLLFEAGWY